jgi:saccharopine dehydrogenase-like NADP-dependent oxidoreductase
MKVLLLGTGAVGEAIAKLARGRLWLSQMVLADAHPERLAVVQKRLGNPARFPTEVVNAASRDAIVEVARKYDVDLIMNAVTPYLNERIMAAAHKANIHYIDMALTPTKPHPTEPYKKMGRPLGELQWKQHKKFKKRGLLALVGMGMDPGVSGVFAKYAEKHLFDRVDEIHVKDGGNLAIEGYAFAPTFSIWTTIEECLNPPVLYTARKGHFTKEPFSDPEHFHFPDGIGRQKLVNVEHEELMTLPKHIKGVKAVSFKLGLGDQFMDVLRMLHLIGLDSVLPVRVGDIEVSPRDVVAAVTPNPAHLADKMTGKACVGLLIKGRSGRKPRTVFIYQTADSVETRKRFGLQPVAWQTAVGPVIAMDLLNSGRWSRTGVWAPEAFDPDPFIELMPKYDFPYGIQER